MNQRTEAASSSRRTDEFEAYFRRFGFCDRQILSPPAADLGLVVVVPCFNEPDLIGALESLWRCQRPSCSVEVMVVVNAHTESLQSVVEQNERSLFQAKEWQASRSDARCAFHFLNFPNLPPRQAGVGLARKIGMDEAVRRFAQNGRPEGVIVCCDADCRVEENYLVRIAEHFQDHPESPGCSIYFEHPLAGPMEAEIYQAVAQYELHLRFYVQAQRLAGFPHAFHTIGSCMAVRAAAYIKQGGMNKRQAGEDFYFLHKIIPLGGFTNLVETTVYPSPRPSDRVPFGTGKAVRDSLRSEAMSSYPLQAFLDLRQLFEAIPSFGAAKLDTLPAGLPEPLADFLVLQEFPAAIAEIRANTANPASFRKRFFHWFNAFRIMKYVHHARDKFYGGQPVIQEARRLLDRIPRQLRPLCLHEPRRGITRELAPSPASDLSELLRAYRQLDRRPEE